SRLVNPARGTGILPVGLIGVPPVLVSTSKMLVVPDRLAAASPSRGGQDACATLIRIELRAELHWPAITRLLKSGRALARATSSNRGRGNLRPLHRSYHRGAFFSADSLSFRGLAPGTKLSGFSGARRSQDSHTLRSRFSR